MHGIHGMAFINLPLIADCNLPYQKGQHAKYYSNGNLEAVCIMHGLATMATNSGTHDADYNTNTGTDHKECVKHACIYPHGACMPYI
jgi:hypothetical protein